MQTEPDVLTEHNELILSASIERMVSGRDAALVQIEQLIQQLDDISRLTSEIGGGTAQYWAMKSGHRYDSWLTEKVGKAMPAISEANIFSTFEQLHLNKMDVFERGIINVLKGLSWDYKTKSPCSFGKKIIINNLVTHNRWGFSLNWGWRRDQLADLERMLYLLNGKLIPDNRGDVTTRLMDHIRDNPSKDVYEDEFFSICYFQKGTAHLTFQRPELVELMKDIIARHYPGMLAQR